LSIDQAPICSRYFSTLANISWERAGLPNKSDPNLYEDPRIQFLLLTESKAMRLRQFEQTLFQRLDSVDMFLQWENILKEELDQGVSETAALERAKSKTVNH
jgi:hypothetical protein